MMPQNESELARVGAEVTFVAADPLRHSWLAIWTPDSLGDPSRLEIADSIDFLAGLDDGTPATQSLRRIAYATRFALGLIASGKLTPALSPSGIDQWRLSPQSPAETSTMAFLESVSPEDSSLPEYCHAVADIMVRTTAAVTAAGHAAFADQRPVTIDHRNRSTRFAQSEEARRPLSVLRLIPPTFTTDEPWVARLGLASRADTSQVLDAHSLWASADPNNRRYLNAERQLRDAIRRGARVWPPLGALAEQRHPTDLKLSIGMLNELLGNAGQDLGAIGLSVIVPNNELARIELKPVVHESTVRPEAATRGGLSLGSLLEVRWHGEMDGLDISPAEIEQLVTARQQVISVRGRWVHLDSDQLDRLRNPQALSPSAALAAAVGAPIRIGGIEQQIQVRGALSEIGQRLAALALPSEIEPPDGLNGELRPYQQRGLAWLTEMLELRLGGVLADDMGLGKTIQVLALILSRYERARSAEPGTDEPETGRTVAGSALVICPASVVRNWEREANRFAPDLNVVRHHGAQRDLPEIKPGDVVLTTYGVCRRDIEILAGVRFEVIVADEAQAIKNPASRTARALRTLSSDARFALTGTPVQNQLSDLWAILDWATPGLLGTLTQFRKDFASPIERKGDRAIVEQLNAMLRPFVLRRSKSDPEIVPDLPMKTETNVLVSLSAEQAALYRQSTDSLLRQVSASTGIGRRGLVLKLLTELKQICNHPAHYTAKLADDPDQSIDTTLTGRSGKLSGTLDLLNVLKSEGEKALIFTQYVVMGRLLERALGDEGISSEFLHGGQSITARQELVDRFQDRQLDVLIISLRAGGTGLNLTAASHVIHYDRWWNPAVEDQASDRAWRIGQTKPVQIHRMVSEGTIEDKIAQLLDSKRDLAESVVGSGEAWISEMDNAELAALVRLGDSDIEVESITLTEES